MKLNTIVRHFTILVLTLSTACATDFYVDPVTGDDSNDGSTSKPWKSLQSVFDSKKIQSRNWEKLPYKEDAKLISINQEGRVRGGDTIWLRTGNHGVLTIKNCYNTETITIAAEKGNTPCFNSILIRSGSNWALKGLHIQPEPGAKKRTMIDLDSHGWSGPVNDITIEDCDLKSVEDSSGWTAEDWNRFACNGIDADGTRITVRNNKLKNVNFGISVSASHALVENNSIANFCGDGMRGLGNHSVFQYNTVKNCFDVNDNHDDGFQSWASEDRKAGRGEVVDIVLRGNTIINYEDPNQPHRGPLQGIGCFDGIYRDFVIENNLIIVDQWHGITLLGAKNCRIINNTVVDPNTERPGPPWIMIGPHKNGTPSEGCIIRNNIASSSKAGKGCEKMTVDHNLPAKELSEIFIDPAKGDLRLKKESPALDAGSSESAPETDIAGTPRPQGAAVDIGAYEMK